MDILIKKTDTFLEILFINILTVSSLNQYCRPITKVDHERKVEKENKNLT